MPTHKGKMDAECTTAMWSDAGVGVAAKRITMKHFIAHFGHKFTVPEASINKLAADSNAQKTWASFWHEHSCLG